MATDPNLQNAEASIEAAQTELNTDAAQIATDQQAISADQAALDAAQAANSQLLAQVSRLSRPSTIYAGLEKNPLGPDNKTLFQWAQPGNAGNSGGTSTLAHGTSTWTPGAGPNGSTLITIHPANIAPHSDDFEFYNPLTHPDVDPRLMRWGGDFYCPTEADWLKSQQMEFQREHIANGWRYTGAWAINPHTGLNYWAAAGKWKQFLNPSGAVIMVDMGKPQNFIAHWDVDTINHTFTPKFIIVSGEKVDTGLGPIAALPTDPTHTEHSTEIQLDGQAAAASYSAVLNNHWAEWQ